MPEKDKESDILKKNNVNTPENEDREEEAAEEETGPEPLGWDFIDGIFKKIYKKLFLQKPKSINLPSMPCCTARRSALIPSSRCASSRGCR